MKLSMMLNMSKKTSIFHYSKSFGNLTCVIRLKVAVNMADLTCLFGAP